MAKEKLKPCPFCDAGEPIRDFSMLKTHRSRFCPDETAPAYFVRCSMGWYDSKPYCGCKVEGYATEEEAVKAWNRRAKEVE